MLRMQKNQILALRSSSASLRSQKWEDNSGSRKRTCIAQLALGAFRVIPVISLSMREANILYIRTLGWSNIAWRSLNITVEVYFCACLTPGRNKSLIFFPLLHGGSPDTQRCELWLGYIVETNGVSKVTCDYENESYHRTQLSGNSSGIDTLFYLNRFGDSCDPNVSQPIIG